MFDGAAAMEVERYRKLERVERTQTVAGGEPPDQFPRCPEMVAADAGKPRFSVGEVPIKLPRALESK